MNKKTLKIAGWALGLSMAVAGIGAAIGAPSAMPAETMMVMAAADETFTASSAGYSNQAVATTYEGDDFSISWSIGTNASNAPKYYTSGSAVRCYGGNTFTVSSATKTINKIELGFGNSDGSNEITTNVATYSNGTWTGSSNSVTFSIGGTSGNRRIASVSIYYAAPAAESELDSIEITLDPENLKTNYYIGDSISLTGVDVIAHYADDSEDHSIIADPGLELTYDMVALEGMETVTILAEYGGKDDDASFNVTVIADFVKSLSFTGTTAAQFDIFEGSTLTAAMVSSWTVKPVWDSGKTADGLVYGSGYTLRTPNGTISSLPYTWQVGDTSITAVYSANDAIISTKNVTVTPVLNSVIANVEGDVEEAFVAADQGYGNADDLSNWSGNQFEMTFNKGTAQNAPKYYESDETARFYKNSNIVVASKDNVPLTKLVFAGTVGTKVSANVGTWNSSTNTWTGSATSITFSASDTVKMTSLTATYHGMSERELANNTDHKSTQRAVCEYATFLNETMAVDGVCGTNNENFGAHTSLVLKAAWQTVANKYDDMFGSGENALSGDELAWAKAMLSNATPKWDIGRDCLQRAMKTYDFVIQNYSDELITAGMSVPNFMLNDDGTTPLRSAAIVNNSTTYSASTGRDSLPLILAISSVGFVTLGGAFLISRRRKEDR